MDFNGRACVRQWHGHMLEAIAFDVENAAIHRQNWPQQLHASHSEMPFQVPHRRTETVIMQIRMHKQWDRK
jgi:hypothetical protein